MKRIPRILAGLGIATAVALGATTPALGTTGFFLYTTPTGQQEQLDNPRSNTCHTIEGNGRAYNGTNKVVALYASRDDCEGTATQFLRPRQHGADVEFKSAEFIR